MDAIEQMMLVRAKDLQQIVGGKVTIQCQYLENHHDAWFSWYASVRSGKHENAYAFHRTYAEAVNKLISNINEMQKLEESARVCDPIALGM